MGCKNRQHKYKQSIFSVSFCTHSELISYFYSLRASFQYCFVLTRSLFSEDFIKSNKFDKHMASGQAKMEPCFFDKKTCDYVSI